MTERQVINFADLPDYVPYDGDGAAALLPFDGYVRVQVKNYKETVTAGDTPKPQVALTLKVAEDDLPPHTLYGRVFTGGVDKNKKSLLRQFYDVLVSSGLYTVEDLNKAAARGDSKGVGELLDEIIRQNSYLYVEVEHHVYKGKESSGVNNFVTQKLYEKEVNAGTARKTRTIVAGTGTNGSRVAGGAPSELLKNVI